MPVMLLYAISPGKTTHSAAFPPVVTSNRCFRAASFGILPDGILGLVKLVPVGGLRNFRRQVHWLHAKNSCSHLSRSRKATRIKLQTRFPTRFWMRALLKILTAASPAKL